MVSGHLTPAVWNGYALGLPALLFGLALGFRLEKRIQPALFRRLVLILLVVVGARLLLAASWAK